MNHSTAHSSCKVALCVRERECVREKERWGRNESRRERKREREEEKEECRDVTVTVIGDFVCFSR